MKKRFSVKNSILIIFCSVMVISAVLLIVYAGALFQGLSHRTEEEARNTIHNYLMDFEKNQQIMENSLANMVLTNAYFRQLSAIQDQGELYLASHALQESLSTLLAASSEPYSLMLYHSGCDLMLTAQRGTGGIGESGFPLELQLKQALHAELSAGTANTATWFTLPIGKEIFFCRAVRYQNIYCCCSYALSNLTEGFNGASPELALFYDGQPILGRTPVIPYADLPPIDGGASAAYMGWWNRYLVSQAEYGQLRLVRYSLADVGTMNPLLLIALPLAVVLTAFLLGLIYLRKSVYQPMQNLVESLGKISSGESSAQLLDRVYAGEEFRQVNSTVKDLLTQITELKLESYERELESRDAQLQYLRAQIRPHFYLNCLKNLYAMAETDAPEQIQESILLLSKYMRYIFTDQDHFIPLQNELESCQNYIKLFASMNTGFAPECRVDVDAKLMELEIPPVSLLTLVENAVKYSLREDDSFRLLITASVLPAGSEGDMVNITVRDNGPGFPQEVLSKLNRMNTESETDTHVGIRNVLQRFAVLYGDRFQIGFFNGGPHEVYCGARIELFFPLNEEPSN